jgi:hypothetical protein
MSADASPAQLAAALALLAQSGRPFETRLTGVSMGATIPGGATIRVQPQGVDAARAADVVVFRDGEAGLVAHRLVCRGRGRARDYVITLGDGNRFPDPPVPVSAILGKVISFSTDEATWLDVPPPAPRGAMGEAIVKATVWALVAASAIHVSLVKFLIPKR